MTPIQQCLQSLAVLAESDDLNGISLAESKIDEFVRTAGTESAWQLVALDDLKHEITDRGWGTTCRCFRRSRTDSNVRVKFEALGNMFMVKAVELDIKLQKIANGNYTASSPTRV